VGALVSVCRLFLSMLLFAVVLSSLSAIVSSSFRLLLFLLFLSPSRQVIVDFIVILVRKSVHAFEAEFLCRICQVQVSTHRSIHTKEHTTISSAMTDELLSGRSVRWVFRCLSFALHGSQGLSAAS